MNRIAKAGISPAPLAVARTELRRMCTDLGLAFWCGAMAIGAALEPGVDTLRV